ncbi:MAG: NAD-dependent epimerase/dehydratase family protein, partial [Planctomycetales bacterium]
FAPEAIYHLAGVSEPGKCGAQEPNELAASVNIQGTARVMALAASLPGRPRVLFVSSCHVYARVSREAPFVHEDDPLQPWNGYGVSKLRAEEKAFRAFREDGVDVIVARSCQHAGPGQALQFMLPEWASQFADESDAPVQVQTLDAWLDFTDARDVVRAYRLLMLKAPSGLAYNVGGGKNVRSGDVFELLRKQANSSRAVLQISPGERQEPIADISRLIECTGWKPEISLEQTVADVYQDWQLRLAQPAPRILRENGVA